MIPDETARKFKSLYTDRIRLVNLALLSLLVASIALLAIDARLLLSTHYWRRFQLNLGTVGGTGADRKEKMGHTKLRETPAPDANSTKRSDSPLLHSTSQLSESDASASEPTRT